MGRVGLVVSAGAGACPNLPQRRSGPVSTVSGGAEYQRFFSRAPARSGPLWQIWTNGVRGPVGEGVRGSGGGHCGRPDDRGDHFDDPTGPAGAPVREGPRHPARSRPPEPVPGPRPSPGPASPSPTLRERVGFQSNAQMGGARSTRNLRARGRTTGRGSANRPQNALSPPASPRPLPDEKDSAPPDVPGITFLTPKDAETCTSHSKVQGGVRWWLHR